MSRYPRVQSRSRSHASLNEEQCWDVLCRRIAGDRAFVYAVRTTGIYCRPTCRSRRPLRTNVEFHATPEAARAAGFRACLRCRPDETHPGTTRETTIARICALIDASERLPPLVELARAADMSPSHFHRVFRATVGVTPRAYAAARRSARMRRTLKDAPTVTQAVFAAGYESSSAFYADGRHTLGMQPSTYRRGARGLAIRFGVAPCQLGYVLAAATAQGLCAIFLGDHPDGLTDELSAAYPQAQRAARDPAFDRLLEAVVEMIDCPEQSSTLPLDIRGTAFQRRVWQALLAIPPGTTLSYSELAQRIGTPRAVRAVASACAANTLAIAIPCHRVVRNDGQLAGYRWGLDRKRALIEREARLPKAAVKRRSG